MQSFCIKILSFCLKILYQTVSKLQEISLGVSGFLLHRRTDFPKAHKQEIQTKTFILSTQLSKVSSDLQESWGCAATG